MRGRRTWAILLASAGAFLWIEAGWIHAKAWLAQVLLERAWGETLAGGGPARPWPWADTRPVGRLWVPAHGVDLVVLAGASGRTLAFAPGHLSGSAGLDGLGNSVLAGHRDTHFAFLRRLELGDEIRTENADGETHRYRVVDLAVVEERDMNALDPWAPPSLTLVTCYPFDTPVPGGPLRYVVTAELEGRLAERLPSLESVGYPAKSANSSSKAWGIFPTAEDGTRIGVVTPASRQASSPSSTLLGFP